MMGVHGAIEAGGTKFNCMVARSPDDVIAEGRFDTTTPHETFEKVIAFFRAHMRENTLEGIGIGSFGPIDLDKTSPMYGYITSTPKLEWANVDFVGRIKDALGVQVVFDTDVNAAAVGEKIWGAAKGLTQFLYLTIGTGIGGGVVAFGNPLHGLTHPEIGHILIPHDRSEDPFEGSCPYHGDCFEGLASGPAILARWGKSGQDLPEDHPAWMLESVYIARALHSLICAFSPQRIILGGGVMHQEHLFPLIRDRVRESLAGYVQSPSIIDRIDEFIVSPGLGDKAGVLGALAMSIHNNMGDRVGSSSP